MPSAPDPFFPIRAAREWICPVMRQLTMTVEQLMGRPSVSSTKSMATARDASARSRPLPLFYAVSQAGRAVSAARSDEPWKLRHHGLTAPELDYADLD